MAAASIVMRDTEDGSIAMEVVFGDGFNKDSPAHAGVRRCLDFLDSLGMEIQEPLAPEAPKIIVEGNGEAH